MDMRDTPPGASTSLLNAGARCVAVPVTPVSLLPPHLLRRDQKQVCALRHGATTLQEHSSTQGRLRPTSSAARHGSKSASLHGDVCCC